MSQYRTDLYAIYKSEVMGEALFAGAAACTLSAERKQKWLRLAALETQTKQRYLDFVAEDSALRRFPVFSLLLGKLLGPVFAMLPWSMAMKALGDGTDSFLEIFARLQKTGAEQDRGFFDYVLAHEQAIKAFANAERAGELNSLAKTEALLQ